MSSVKFDTDVPMPTSKKDIAREIDFAKMEVGASFFRAGDTKACDKYSGAAREWGKKQAPARTFVAVRRTEDDEAGVRVWRRT